MVTSLGKMDIDIFYSSKHIDVIEKNTKETNKELNQILSLDKDLKNINLDDLEYILYYLGIIDKNVWLK